jgi:cell fate regulator YaaT (PSP1 superfamily)
LGSRLPLLFLSAAHHLQWLRCSSEELYCLGLEDRIMSARYIVRHGAMRFLGEYEPVDDAAYHRGDTVVVRSERGLETAEVLCEATDRAIKLIAEPTRGQIVRLVNEKDLAEIERLRRAQETEFDNCRQYIASRKLQMELVDVEHLFGGDRVVFYFLAEKRVDFRELVKDLAREFRTRIEMRQIGVRDEAKLLADYGDCGKPVCCNTHMYVMPPVSMRMAKLQKSTLDPSKISGRCGRLKCCLRFEQDVYEEFQKELPQPGSRVVTAKGKGRVLAQEILARKVLVEFEDGRQLPVAIAEILTRLS